MNLLFPRNAVGSPITGIGRYTLELARHMVARSDVDSVDFIGHGRVIPAGTMLASIAAAREETGNSLRRNPLRHLARIPGLQAAASTAMRLHLAAYLKRLPNPLFHGTNYQLPSINAPQIVTIHDLSVLRFPEWHPGERVRVMRKAIPDAISRARFVITDSEFVRQEVLREFSLDPVNVLSVGLGVDSSFRPMTEDQLRPVLARFGLVPSRYCLCVATIEPRKNLENLLGAYDLLDPGLRRNLPLVLIGNSGWRADTIMLAIRQAQTCGWLHYLGGVSEQYLPALYAGSRVFVFPSLYEGFGLPVLEAMASGTPVITSRGTAMEEFAGKKTLYVDPLSRKDIAEAIGRAAQDESWRESAVAEGLDAASLRSWSACGALTADVYSRALHGR